MTGNFDILASASRTDSDGLPFPYRALDTHVADRTAPMEESVATVDAKLVDLGGPLDHPDRIGIDSLQR